MQQMLTVSVCDQHYFQISLALFSSILLLLLLLLLQCSYVFLPPS